VTFSAPTRPPLPKVVETRYKVLASTTSASRQARSAAVPGARQWNNISFPLFVWERLQSGCTGWQLLLIQGQTIWPIPGELNHWVLQTSGVGRRRFPVQGNNCVASSAETRQCSSLWVKSGSFYSGGDGLRPVLSAFSQKGWSVNRAPPDISWTAPASK
jgi:hypothetical protein